MMVDGYKRRLLGGKTAAEVVRRTGISKGHISLILSGQREPSLGVAARFARAVGLDLTEWERRYRRLLSHLDR